MLAMPELDVMPWFEVDTQHCAHHTKVLLPCRQVSFLSIAGAGWQGVAGWPEEACVCLPPAGDWDHRGEGEAFAARHADAGHVHSLTLFVPLLRCNAGVRLLYIFIGATACEPHQQCSACTCVQVYQRQLSKEGLQALVNNAAGGGAVGSAAEDDAPAGGGGGPNIQSAVALRTLCFAQFCRHTWRRCQQEQLAEPLSSPSSPIASVPHTVRYMPADYRTPPMTPRQQRLRSASGGAAQCLSLRPKGKMENVEDCDLTCRGRRKQGPTPHAPYLCAIQASHPTHSMLRCARQGTHVRSQPEPDQMSRYVAQHVVHISMQEARSQEARGQPV